MSNPLSNLSARERRLIVITLLVIGGSACVLLGLQGYNRIASLYGEIDRLEQELMNLTQHNAQLSAVEEAYRQVVGEHPAEMTKEEIHDNLRREIFRLAKTVIPAKGGRPAREVDLVRIPTLREGLLREEGEGYREYEIRFRIPLTRVQNLMRFLQRIETSSQILRIDSLDLSRSPESTQVQATLVITRTVLDNPDAASPRGGAGVGARVSRVGSV